MSTDQLTLSSLSSFGDVVPVGSYVARVKAIEAKEAENAEATSYVSLAFEILSGESEGLTISLPFFPKITKSAKNGKYYSRGLSEAQATAAAWGAPLPDFPVTEFLNVVTPKGARLLQKVLGDSFKKAGSPRLRIRVVAEKQQAKNETTGKWEDKKNDDGSQAYRNRVIVVGREGGAESSPRGIEGSEASNDTSNGDPLSFV